jgi:hypothetical protein
MMLYDIQESCSPFHEAIDGDEFSIGICGLVKLAGGHAVPLVRVPLISGGGPRTEE